MVAQDWTVLEKEMLLAVYCAGWEGVTCPQPSSMFHADAARSLVEQGVIEWRESGYGLSEEYLLPVALMFKDCGLTNDDVFDLVFGTQTPLKLSPIDERDVLAGLFITVVTIGVITFFALLSCGAVSI